MSNPTPNEVRNQQSIDWNASGAPNPFSDRFASAYLANSWCSDIEINIPKDGCKIPAHKWILVAASPMLEECCCRNIVEAPDCCTTEVMFIVLRYLYSGGHVEGVTEYNAALVLKTADHFQLIELRTQCEAKITAILSVSNVCSIFDTIHDRDIPLVDYCLCFMQNNTSAVLANGSAMTMCDAALAKLLQPNNLLKITSECELVQAMYKMVSREITPTERRHALKRRIIHIHFGAMSSDDFMRCVELLGNGFFTNDEISLTNQQIYYLANGKTPNNDPDVYPFHSNNRIKEPDQNKPIEFDTFRFNRRLKNILDFDYNETMLLDVSHMKKPFTLTGIMLSKSAKLRTVSDGFTKANVAFTLHNRFIRFVPGVLPDTDGRICLHLKINKGCWYKISLSQDQSEHPKMLDTYSSITSIYSITYTIPE